MEEQSWFDIFLGWIATGLLWFIYAMLFVMAIGVTIAILSSKRIISWFGAIFLAFCYTIVFGRWWDYDYAFIAFSIIFVGTKLYFVLSAADPKMILWIEKVILGKDRRDERKLNK